MIKVAVDAMGGDLAPDKWYFAALSDKKKAD